MRRCSLDMTVANSPTAPAKISFLLEALEELGLAVGGDEESPPGEGGCCLITSKRCIKDSVLGLISKSPPDSGEAAFGGPATVGTGLGLGASALTWPLLRRAFRTDGFRPVLIACKRLLPWII